MAGAHGVRGLVRLKTFTAAPDGVAAYGPVETEDGARRFEVEVLSELKDGLVLARLSGISDRTAAEALRSARLFVPRSALPPPEEEEFYHADLIGLEAESEAGAALGTVRAVHDFGAGDLLEIAPPSGPARLVPFTRADVPLVDLPGGRVVIAEAALAEGVGAPEPSGEDGR
ncbi:MAG: 16S rRNA processing protein RimM [Alphaproteobacteria bacterium]|nr:16S rRNA processing protein RimM [Alphaproteobacteria bacterium]